jgi:hypothetical protein
MILNFVLRINMILAKVDSSSDNFLPNCFKIYFYLNERDRERFLAVIWGNILGQSGKLWK